MTPPRPRAWNSTLPLKREKPRRTAPAAPSSPEAASMAREGAKVRRNDPGPSWSKNGKRRSGTRIEKAHLSAVASLGCVVCRRLGYGFRLAEIHHLRRNPETGEHYGMSRRAPHAHTIPLCPDHHRQGGFGTAFHAGPGEFERAFGTETELWNYTEMLLGLWKGAA